MKKGNLFLIPNTLGDTQTAYSLPRSILEAVEKCDEFIVENERSARRFIKKLGSSKNLDTLVLYSIGKHSSEQDYPSYLNNIHSGKNIGVISESGCPAIADPGAKIVQIAHEQNIRVIPLIGPSSILLALIASGFNGQNFAFNGYLPKEGNLKMKKIKLLEKQARQHNQTQIFIETPFRNQKLLDDLIKYCLPNTMLCIATDITLDTERIKTKSIHEWSKNIPNLNKKNTVFVIGS